MDVVVGHKSVDFDALAAMVAATRLFPGCRLLFPGSLNPNARRFYGLYLGEMLELKPHELRSADVRRLIVVDTRDRERIGDVAAFLDSKPGLEVIVFDHHPAGPSDIKADEKFLSVDGSLTTAMVGILRDKGVVLSADEATLYALGIHEDTGSLTNSGSTANDAEALAWLMEHGAMPEVINEFLNSPFTAEHSLLMSDLLESAEVVDIAGTPVMIATAERDGFIEDLAVLAHRAMDMTGEKALFVIVRMHDRIYVVGRSVIGSVDVARILKPLGGGGHAAAASASLRERDVAAVRARLMDSLLACAGRPVTAADIMEIDVLKVAADAPLDQVEGLLARSGRSGLAVMDGESFIGVVTRREIDKAKRNGLLHAPVKGFLAKRGHTVTPETTFTMLERLMVEEGLAHLPVLSGEKLLGVVRQKDLTKAMLKRHPVAAPPLEDCSGPAVGSRMSALFSRPVMSLLREAGRAAEGSGRVYLVGGMVRDLMLGKENVDIDLLVEGDAISFAGRLATSTGGDLRRHERFGTAAVTLPDGLTVDVAGARVERYERPSGPPRVRAASLRQDLFRRDFTVNALAISLNEDDFGHLIDCYSGLKDLERGLIRVLHDFSFIEDPIRVVRGVRFEQRLGFRFTSGTERQARNAIALELLTPPLGTRFREELRVMLEDARAAASLRRLEDLGFLPLIGGARYPGDEAVRAIIEALRVFSGLHPRRHLAMLGLLLHGRKPEEVLDWAGHMRFRKKEMKCLAEAATMSDRLADALSRDEMPASELVELLKPVSPETLAVMLATRGEGRVRERLLAYLRRPADATIGITGADLLALGYPPSRKMGDALRRIRKALLDGSARSREEQLAMARELLGDPASCDEKEV